MTDQMKQIWQRALGFQYEDGLVEIGMGAMFIIIGFGQLLMWFAKEQAKPVWIVVASISMVGLIWGGTVLMNRIVGRLKEEIIYPRAGYVELRQPKNKRGSVFLISFSLAFAISMIISIDTPLEWINHMGLVIGVIMAAIMVFIGAQAQVRRFYFVAVVAFIAGLVLVYLNAEEILSASIVFGILGLALIVTGGVALSQFLQRPTIDTDNEVL